MRRILLLLSIALLLLSMSVREGLAQTLSATISPSSISTKPGERERLSLTVRNMGTRDIDVTGIRLRITSRNLSGIPISLYLGEYSFPFDRPERVIAGGQRVIERVVEVPLIPFAGDFDVEVIVETIGGTTSTRMRVYLLHSWLSMSFLLLSLLIAAGLIYALLKLALRRVRRREVYHVNDLLAERDRYYKLLRELEARKGRMGESEYRELREEYASGLRRVQSALESMLPSLQERVGKLEREAGEIEAEIRRIRARVEVKEIKRSEAESQIRRREAALEERRRRIRELRDLIDRIRGT
ncbi:MAG: hypothetical protein BA066_05960 [Candidatus Korarchaeota archaeon NZ13-K]|nr:MAG: hypothetical protein BA066_05960 [Candidatus Korarchaeota archaeon NZ13-K]